MAKILYQHITQVEYDTETNKSRMIKGFTTILSDKEVKAKKPKQLKPMTTKQLEDEYL